MGEHTTDGRRALSFFIKKRYHRIKLRLDFLIVL